MKPIFKVIIGLTCSTTFLLGAGFPASYYNMSGKAQKREFINILKPLIDKSNKKIMEERTFVEDFFKQALSSSLRSLNSNNLKKLLSISKKYRVKNIFDKNTYLKRVDLVPVPLALVQGAIESGWGKSRFVREANNIFGHWTWGKIGIIPAGREEGKTHKIRIFNTMQDSVDAYMLNLNRHNAYQGFRDARFRKREEGMLITGYEAADTMINYSELKEKYVDMLHKMMKEHRLLYYDAIKKQKFSSNMN